MSVLTAITPKWTATKAATTAAGSAGTTATLDLALPIALPGDQVVVAATNLESGAVIGNAFVPSKGIVRVTIGSIGATAGQSTTFKVVAL